MSQVKFRSTLFKGLRVVGQSPTVLTLWGVSLKKARETAKRLSRPVAHRKGGFPKAGLRANACPLRPPLEGTSPKGGGEAWLCASFMAAHILGSPLGGAGTASAVTERARRYRPGKAQATKGCQAVSLAFFSALRAHKVKGKVAPFLKKRRPKKL